ncbi:MAG: cobalamin biosynthesis protein CobW [Pseudomonadota bacterium]|nr:cobalamin biosynthesis protein CobW [Pseudomonadota bacterium]MEC8761017.1 cobalamin biosynthesis protein CobW [Pseudomonadota bacterium]
MSSLEKIPVTILTGFLGAGKTTLIRNLILKNKSKKLAVIINEFGDLGVDGEIVKQCSDETCPEENILELANGCICCTVADDFIPTMKSLLEGQYLPEHILIETSGLALPKPLLKAFEWPEIRSRLTVDSVLAVVDAEAVVNGIFAPQMSTELEEKQNQTYVEHETPLSEVFEDQINCSDVVLLTKPDLVKNISDARNIIIKEMERNVPILEVQNGDIGADVILGVNAAAETDLDNRRSHHDGFDDHEHDDFDTFSITVPKILDVEKFKIVLEKLIRENDILRIKGFLRVESKPLNLLVQGVGKRLSVNFTDTKIPVENTGNLVFIGEKGRIDQDVISAYLHSSLN